MPHGRQRLANGLVVGHAYGVTDVRKVKSPGLFADNFQLVRLRNPWGAVEWKGAFSEGSPEWDRISKSDKQRIGLTIEEDGEFWMLVRGAVRAATGAFSTRPPRLRTVRRLRRRTMPSDTVR